jgi:undecaprenyl-diphosphatase
MATASWLRALGAVSHWHRPQAIAAASALALAVLLWRRQGVEALWLFCTVGGGATLNDWVKHAMHRPRPGDEGVWVAATDFSFPSGHVANATLLYGALALLLVGHLRSRAWQAAVLLAAAGAVVLVAASRLALGAHYPSDVAAGAALAVAWLALCAGALPGRQRRASGG